MLSDMHVRPFGDGIVDRASGRVTIGDSLKLPCATFSLTMKLPAPNLRILSILVC